MDDWSMDDRAPEMSRDCAPSRDNDEDLPDRAADDDVATARRWYESNSRMSFARGKSLKSTIQSDDDRG